MKHNFVAKHMNTFNRSSEMKNKRTEFRQGKQKHKPNYKQESKDSFHIARYYICV